MGLLKRMLNRGLSGAETPPPSPDSPIRVRPFDEPPTAQVYPPPEPGQWPPGPPPTMPPIHRQADSEIVEPDPTFGLEAWRHPVSLHRKELWESGFEYSGAKITKAFEANGQTVRLSETDDTLGINDVKIPRDADDLSYLEITHNKSGASFSLAAPTWALAVALHDAYLEPLDPERSWQIGVVDEEAVLFLARPEEIAAIGRRSSLPIVADLAELEVR